MKNSQDEALRWLHEHVELVEGDVGPSKGNKRSTKETYLDLIELALNGYDLPAFHQASVDAGTGHIPDVQAYSRVTSIVGILLANGRIPEHRQLWASMMTACCEDLHRHEGNLMVDFAVKEVMLAYFAMEDKVDSALSAPWLTALGLIEPYRNYYYTNITVTDKEKLHNINIYNMVGEYLRERAGLTDATAYFAAHWPHQLTLFDENGMYKDPGNPTLYDLTTRCQIQLLLGSGYEGPYREALDEQLKKAGLQTLFMQSAAGELPYGGRSNQYLFNEALLAANAEYEACRYKELGDLKTAGAFKRAARLAIDSLHRWLIEESPPRHIKNFFPTDSGYGTEDYGYYAKYMATFGTFLYIAVLSVDDSIEEYTCPAEIGGYAWQTSDAFHKVFANCGGYSIEIDTRADAYYDATGLGRLHKRGVPSELALSMPCAAEPKYRLPETVRGKALSLCAGWMIEAGDVQWLCEGELAPECKVVIVNEALDEVEWSVTYSGGEIPEGMRIRETYALTEAGLAIGVEQLGEVEHVPYYQVPLLLTNGKYETMITSEDKGISVVMGDYRYDVVSEHKLTTVESKLGNRNGIYTLARFEGEMGRPLQLLLKLTSGE
ncbi:hypothetical protein [Paenibacillus qinlingensis]|uniref:hypothetical protein n=1 Tax=Paenibacillus qinlingensis TaxID=1837343 RepID=UPI0015634D1F|nr:hypothetical protein [Paenibacillus qinlingensis]NQX62770.1 hypothetical protein [Paenibacillus qinlingensis]